MTGIALYTTLTNFSTNYLMMCKVFTDKGGKIVIPCLSNCTLNNIIAKADGVTDKPWYNCYVVYLAVGWCTVCDSCLVDFFISAQAVLIGPDKHIF